MELDQRHLVVAVSDTLDNATRPVSLKKYVGDIIANTARIDQVVESVECRIFYLIGRRVRRLVSGPRDGWRHSLSRLAIGIDGGRHAGTHVCEA